MTQSEITTEVSATGPEAEAAVFCSAIAAEPLTIGDIVGISEQGRAAKVAATDQFDLTEIGLVCSQAVQDAVVTVIRSGTLCGVQDLISGTHYFLDPVTPGTMTSDVPNLRGECIVYLGQAASDSELRIDIHRPIQL